VTDRHASQALLPVIVVFVIFALLIAFGPRLPRRALALLGPIGVLLIAYVMITTYARPDRRRRRVTRCRSPSSPAMP
jgi:hypothetical protein